MASELGGSQILTLLETLPGIANVLRSPVADALNNVIRAAARLSEFNVADAEELVRYATRRSLMGQEDKARAKPKPTRPVKAVKAVKKVKVKKAAKVKKR